MTVHGRQGHVVKNHEQPKGTIRSLEKALDRYGVPVSKELRNMREFMDLFEVDKKSEPSFSNLAKNFSLSFQGHS
jgi:hypothetical protein